jgi:hypothetical protein
MKALVRKTDSSSVYPEQPRATTLAALESV